ncbi:KpsF/GutQ family sugar-phosphate isomerase [soil metagenome]
MAVTAKTRSRSQAPKAVLSARTTIATERDGLTLLHAALEDGLAAPFAKAVGIIRTATTTDEHGRSPGRVIVTGIGKSGHIGRKIAATLASTGTQAFFIHASEASHGDLGMVGKDDIILALSWTGESAELRDVVEYSRRFAIPLIAVTSVGDSALGRRADLVLPLPLAKEACPHGLTPTTSAVMQLALGDALAMALLEERGFTADEFRVFHPGGKLGANLHFVRHIMHRGDALPLVAPETTLAKALPIMSEKGLGCVGAIDRDGKLVGIVTDGDLRRHMGPDLLKRTVREVMTPSPKSVPPDCLVGDALAMMSPPTRPFTVLFVVEDDKPVGIVHMHDFLRLGVA